MKNNHLLGLVARIVNGLVEKCFLGQSVTSRFN